MRVVFDTNVVIYATTNQTEYAEAQKLVMAVAEEKIEGLITANSITDIYYILRKRIGDTSARDAIWNMMTVFDVVETDADTCIAALGSPMKDFEDAVVTECAKKVSADFIVTEDKDFLAEENSPVKTISVKDLTALI